jgi:hypothetical protein
MKLFVVLITLFFMNTIQASEEVLFESSFRSLTPMVKVTGDAQIISTEEGRHFVAISDFRLRGGVVLDLKVCGEALPQQYACISIGEPRKTKQMWEIPFAFSKYTKIVIFDLDLIADLAVAD